MADRAHSCRRRCCCCGCLLLVLLLAVPAALLFRAPSPPPLPPPAERARIQARLAKTRQEVEAIRRDAQEGRVRPFTLRFTEEEMNVFLATDNQARALLKRRGIERAFARMEAGRILGTATGVYQGLSVTVTGIFRPKLNPDGTPGFTMESVQAGSLTVPPSMARRAANALMRAMAASTFNASGVRLKTLRVEPGVVVMEGDTG